MFLPRRVLSLQGHPEFNEDIVREILEKKRRTGGIEAAEYRDGLDRVSRRHDGLLVGGVLLKFLLGDHTLLT
jgi:hypothetical protein